MSVMRLTPSVTTIGWRRADGRASWCAAKRPDRCLPARRPVPHPSRSAGVDPDAIELTVEQNVLTIRAERRFEPEEGDEPVISERPQGTFTRQLLLGESLDTDGLEADYDQGVLTLRIPVAEAAKPRRVEITKSAAASDRWSRAKQPESPDEANPALRSKRSSQFKLTHYRQVRSSAAQSISRSSATPCV